MRMFTLDRNYLLFFLLIFYVNSAAQQRATGLLLDDVAYQQIPVLDRTGEKYNNIPRKKSLKNYTPRPGDQGALPSCVSWAVGYAALTISKAIAWDMDDPKLATTHAHSASFIFNWLKKGQDCYSGGLRLDDALSVLKSNGDCLDREFQRSAYSCQRLPLHKEIEAASAYKIGDYARLFEPAADAEDKINSVEEALAANLPVVVGLKIDTAFFNLKSVERWHPVISETMENHALVLVGYDQIRREFELMNSFGEAWGTGGFIKMSYDDFGRVARYGCVISFKSDALAYRKEQAKGGHFFTPSVKLDFETLSIDKTNGESDLVFVKDYPQLDTIENYYTLEKTLGAVYRLKTRKMISGQFGYLFSVDASGKAALHWDSSLDSSSNIIPNDVEALALTIAGIEYLCLLVSDQEIDFIDDKVKDFAKTEDPFSDQLKTIFGSRLNDLQQIKYSPYLMQFTPSTFLSKGSITPLILKIVVQ